MLVKITLSKKGFLTITGDAGSAMLKLPGADLLSVASQMIDEDYDKDYIRSCVVAAEKHFWHNWCADQAMENAQLYIKSRTYNLDDWIWWEEPLSKFKADTEYTDCFDSQQAWIMWLTEHGQKFFGTNWHEHAIGFGEKSPLFLVVIKEALYRTKIELERK
jgi:hypothetical protein